MRSEAEANRAVEKYADTVRRVCFIHLKNSSDAEDVFQEVFLKYILSTRSFESDAHEKAWLIRVAINCCRDTLRRSLRHKIISLELVDSDPISMQMQDGNREVLEAVLKLPDKYRDIVYLFYYEGYKAVEIAKLLGRSENTVYTWLSRAKAKLKDILGGEFFD